MGSLQFYQLMIIQIIHLFTTYQEVNSYVTFCQPNKILELILMENIIIRLDNCDPCHLFIGIHHYFNLSIPFHLSLFNIWIESFINPIK